MTALVLHGGAWDIPDDVVDAHVEGIRAAMKTGWAVLHKGGSAVEAVEMAIRAMEDDETFDAGKGSFLNLSGEVELEAGIMNGRNLRAGAAAGVQNIRNPISLARTIMEKSEHVLLAGIGASRFAREHGVQLCKEDDLIVDREIIRWRDAQAGKHGGAKHSVKKKKAGGDTVGAVALDKAGNLASGTSSGGTPNKHPGRIGDSPLIGCGTFADNESAAVATSGWGEGLMRIVLAKTVADLMGRHEGDPSRAAREGIDLLHRKVDGYGGVIALDPHGRIGIAFNTPRMARGYITTEMKAPVVEI